MPISSISQYYLASLLLLAGYTQASPPLLKATFLKDIFPGTSSSEPWDVEYHAATGRAYFAADDGVHGEELWTSDGTAEGTYMVLDIVPGQEGSEPYYIEPFGDFIFFLARSPVRGLQAWISDGSAGGTSILEIPGVDSPNPDMPFVYSEDQLVFYINPDGAGEQLWITDGSPGGTRMVFDLATESPGSSIALFREVQGRLIFVTTNDQTDENELWAWSGLSSEAPILLRAFPANPDLSFSMGQVEVLGSLWSSFGDQVWTTDGTAAGTLLVQDDSRVRKGQMFSRQEYNGKVLFFRSDDAGFDELWASDGTPEGSLVLLPDLSAASATTVERTVPTTQALTMGPQFGDHGCFVTHDSDLDLYYIWSTDGTAEGTRPLTVTGRPISASSGRDAGVSTWLLIDANPIPNQERFAYRIWATDCQTTAGTYVVFTMTGLETDEPGDFDWFPVDQTKESWLFRGVDVSRGAELWKVERSTDSITPNPTPAPTPPPTNPDDESNNGSGGKHLEFLVLWLLPLVVVAWF